MKVNILEILDYLNTNEDCPICNSKIFCLVKSSFCPTCGVILHNPKSELIPPSKCMDFLRYHRKRKKYTQN